ncbi:hypothetical protein HanIR_Chr08g0360631 [Helianthus annuus]|nr:hypothetical protein HanIR_Chr08g0360631 [Helianthus annuus]
MNIGCNMYVLITNGSLSTSFRALGVGDVPATSRPGAVPSSHFPCFVGVLFVLLKPLHPLLSHTHIHTTHIYTYIGPILYFSWSILGGASSLDVDVTLTWRGILQGLASSTPSSLRMLKVKRLRVDFIRLSSSIICLL